MGQGVAMPALAPRASLQLLSFSPPSLPFTHSSSLLCPPTGTLSAHGPGPVQPPAAGGPHHGGGGHCPPLPHGAAFGARGSEGPEPPWAGGNTQAGGPLALSWAENRGLSPDHAWLLPTPSIAAVHLEKSQLQGGRRCWWREMGPHSCGMKPKAVPSVGRGLWGDPEPAAGTVRLSMELAQATTCSPQPLPPVPSLPPAAPGPGLILTLALPLRSCKSRASLLEPEERARGVWGAQRQLHGGDSSGSAGGAPRGKVGGRRGAWRRDGGRDRRCLWAAGAASSTALHAAAESPHSPPVGERHRETPCNATTEPRVRDQALCSAPCLPTTLQCRPALTSPSRVSMVLIITVFLVCTSEPRCSGLVSAGGGHRGWDHRDTWHGDTAWVWGHWGTSAALV